MSTAAFYSLPSVCQYLTLHRLLVLCHCVRCSFLQTVHCLSVPHIVPPVGSVSLCPLLSPTVCPKSVPHTVPFVGSVSLCPLLSSKICLLSASTSQSTIYSTSVTMYSAVIYSLSNVCQYLTMYILNILCHYAHCCLLHSVACRSVSHRVLSIYSVCSLLVSVNCLSVPLNLPSASSVLLCSPLFFKVCPLSVSTSYCAVPWICVTVSTGVFYILFRVCQNAHCTVPVLCHYVHCCVLGYVHCLSVTHTLLSVFVQLSPLLLSTDPPKYGSTTHCTLYLSLSL